MILMKNSKNQTHNGHRKRLRTLIDNVGLKQLSDVQIVEQILTMTHARCDTNEIAHRLLDKFGSISNILDADINSLTEVEGVGLVTAQTLTYLPQIFEIYAKDKNKSKYPCKTNGDIFNYFKNIFKDMTSECFVIAFVGPNSMFLDHEILSKGEIFEVKIDKFEITKSIIRKNAKSIVIAHNHPLGSCMPSRVDYDSHEYLLNFFSNLGIIFIDNVIIGKDGMFSFKNDQMIEC